MRIGQPARLIPLQRLLTKRWLRCLIKFRFLSSTSMSWAPPEKTQSRVWVSYCHLTTASGGRDSTAPCTTWRISRAVRDSRVQATSLQTSLCALTMSRRDKKGANKKFWRKFKKSGLIWQKWNWGSSKIRIRRLTLAYHRNKTILSPSPTLLVWASRTRALLSSWATRRTSLRYQCPRLRTSFKKRWIAVSMHPTRTELRPLVIWFLQKWVSPQNQLQLWTCSPSTPLTSFPFPSFRGKSMKSVWEKHPASSTRSTKQMRF